MLKKLNKYVKKNPFLLALFTTAFSGFAIYGLSLVGNSNDKANSSSHSSMSLMDNAVGINIQGDKISIIEKNESYVDLKIIDLKSDENSVDIFLKNSGTDSAYITNISCKLLYKKRTRINTNTLCYSTYPINYEIDVNLVKSILDSSNEEHGSLTGYIPLPSTTRVDDFLLNTEKKAGSTLDTNSIGGVLIKENNYKDIKIIGQKYLSSTIPVSQVVPPKGTDWINIKFLAKGGCNLEYTAYCELIYDKNMVLHTGVFPIRPNSKLNKFNNIHKDLTSCSS